jgi:hypothetical protein
MQVEEELAVVILVEESAASSPSSAAAVVEEERAITETTAPQAALEPPTGTGSGCKNMVMVPADDGPAPPPPIRQCDVATSVALKTSAAITTALIEGAEDTSMSRYLTI